MKKIIVIHPIDDFYGASKILAYVVSNLSFQYSVEVWYKHSNSALLTLLTDKERIDRNISYRKISSIPVVHSRMFSFSGLIKFIRDFSIFSLLLLFSKLSRENVLFYINTYAGGVACLPLRLSGYRNIVHCHENQAYKLTGRMLAKLILACATKIICVSSVVKKYVDGGAKTEKSVVIWNGIDDFNNINRERLISQNCHGKTIIIGRVMPEKGHWFLVDIAEILLNKYGRRLVTDVYGDAPPNRPELYDAFRSYIESKNLTDSFFLKGFHPHADRLMMDYDVVFVPSQMSDPFPTTVLEAMRAGKIVIASDHGGAAEIIEHGVNGFLISKDDKEGAANLLNDIMTEQYDLSSIMNNARSFYLQHLISEKFNKEISVVISGVF